MAIWQGKPKNDNERKTTYNRSRTTVIKENTTIGKRFFGYKRKNINDG